jgi:hypothetical protein
MQDNRLNHIVIMRERLLFRSSPKFLGARASSPASWVFPRAGRPRSIFPSPDKGRVGEGFVGVEQAIRGALRRARETDHLCKGGVQLKVKSPPSRRSTAACFPLPRSALNLTHRIKRGTPGTPKGYTAS